MVKKPQRLKPQPLPPPPDTVLDYLAFLVALAQAPVEDLATAPERYYQNTNALPYDQIAVGLHALLHLEGQPEARGPRIEDALIALNPFTDFVAVRDRLRKLFDAIAERKDVRLPVSVTLRIRPAHKAGQQLPIFGARPEDEVMYQTARFIEIAGPDRIRHCAASDCDRLFVKRTKGEYCSTRCQSRTYMRKLREEEKRGDVHAKQTRTRRR